MLANSYMTVLTTFRRIAFPTLVHTMLDFVFRVLTPGQIWWIQTDGSKVYIVSIFRVSQWPNLAFGKGYDISGLA